VGNTLTHANYLPHPAFPVITDGPIVYRILSFDKYICRFTLLIFIILLMASYYFLHVTCKRICIYGISVLYYYYKNTITIIIMNNIVHIALRSSHNRHSESNLVNALALLTGSEHKINFYSIYLRFTQ
jgi:hypothetical protein